MLVESELSSTGSSPERQRPAAIRYATFACYILFVGAAGISLYGATMETSSGATFHFLIGSLSLYLLVECLIHLRRCDAFGLLAPPFLASLLHFFLAYIMPSTGALFDPWILDRFAAYFPSQADQLSAVVPMIALAAFCMWRGYGLGSSSARRLRFALGAGPLTRQKLEPALLPVLGVQVVYFAVVSYAVSLGVYGMASSAELLERNVDLLGTIDIGLAAGSLSLFLLLTYVFRRRAEGQSELLLTIICGVLVCLHVVIGAISGFKSQLAMPFVMLAFARYVATRQISIASIAGACVALIVAYQVIEPYRVYLVSNQLQGQRGIVGLTGALEEAYQQRRPIQEQDISLGAQIVSRLDLTGMTAIGITFAAANSSIALKSEEFAESLYLSPILAFVPRPLWPGKPTYSSGVWFSNEVLGNSDDTTTSVGMGPITWLYIMGGTLGVGLGFLGLGILQVLLFEGVGRATVGGFIIYLSAMSFLTQIPSDFGPALTGMLRLVPIAAAAQFILLRPNTSIKPGRRS